MNIESNPIDEGVEYGPSDLFRTFEVVILNDSTNVSKRHRAWEEGGHDPAAFIADEPDRVVWLEPRVVAVLRPKMGGTLAVLPVGGEGGGR